MITFNPAIRVFSLKMILSEFPRKASHIFNHPPGSQQFNDPVFMDEFQNITGTLPLNWHIQ